MTIIQPVIMAGGKGTRLWPLSRPEKPKQFLPLVSGRVMVADVAALIASRTNALPAVVFTGQEYERAARDALAGQNVGLMVLEPVGRSTAPVAAIASLFIAEHTPEAIIVLLAADSAFLDAAAFHAALDKAITAAEQGELALLGVKPTNASTQFGYIESDGGNRVLSFKEKPDAETAARLVADGRHLWNTGNFVFRGDVMLDQLKQLAPDILASAEAALRGARKDGNVLVLATAMEKCRAISLDHAVMEKTKDATVVRVDGGWLDVDSWAAIWALSDKSIQRFIQILHRFAGGEHGGEKVERPWGTYEVLLRGQGFQVKTIEVRPGQAISLQYHHRRAEHWIVTRGQPRITVGQDTRNYAPDETVFVEVKAIHRIENPTEEPAAILEIQIGDYLGEDDIVRLDDRYDRKTR